MDYRLGDDVYLDKDLEEMEDDELHILKIEAEKYANDCTLIISRGKQEYEKSGRNPNYGLTKAEYAEYTLKRDEAQALIKAIDLVRVLS